MLISWLCCLLVCSVSDGAGLRLRLGGLVWYSCFGGGWCVLGRWGCVGLVCSSGLSCLQALRCLTVFAALDRFGGWVIWWLLG